MPTNDNTNPEPVAVVKVVPDFSGFETAFSNGLSSSFAGTIHPGSWTSSLAEFAGAKKRRWEGVLAVEGIPTSDNRYLMPGRIEWRDLPLTLMAQTVTDEGHKGAFVAGKITEIHKETRPDLGAGAVAIVGTGEFADDEDGNRAADLVDEQILRGVSIDFSDDEMMLLDPETHQPVADEDIDLDMLFSGEYLRGFSGSIMGATLCPFPAFEEANMVMLSTGKGRSVIASAFTLGKVLTAAAAGLAPLKPPKDWFFQQETDGPCPLTVTDEGKVYGHLALWNQCHRQMGYGCEMAPKSRSGYAYFHTGGLPTDDGIVNVGRITVGEGGHAPTSASVGTRGAIDHYDKTGTVAAFVRAMDGRHGIWLSGAVRSDCPAEKVRDMQANPPSGDWREENGRLELCAALAVPVAGFPVPRFEAALVASAEDERVVALIASGYTGKAEFNRAGQRRLSTLKSAARRALT